MSFQQNTLQQNSIDIELKQITNISHQELYRIETPIDIEHNTSELHQTLNRTHQNTNEQRRDEDILETRK